MATGYLSAGHVVVRLRAHGAELVGDLAQYEDGYLSRPAVPHPLRGWLAGAAPVRLQSRRAGHPRRAPGAGACLTAGRIIGAGARRCPAAAGLSGARSPASGPRGGASRGCHQVARAEAMCGRSISRMAYVRASL